MLLKAKKFKSFSNKKEYDFLTKINTLKLYFNLETIILFISLSLITVLPKDIPAELTTSAKYLRQVKISC